MEQEKLRIYFFYGLGEILLVVVGILIALQVNNYNTQRNESKAERILLDSVVESLEEDALLFSEIMDEVDEIDELYQNLYLFTEGEYEAEDISNIRYIRRTFLYNPVVMVNHPDLANELLSRELKQAIRAYYQTMDNVYYVIDTFNIHVEEVVRPYLSELDVFNYGYQYLDETVDLRLANDMINKEILLEELEDPMLQQILFETGIRYASIMTELEGLQNENAMIARQIKEYVGE